MKLSENTRMNEYAIKLIDGKQLLYEPIYALSLVELETLKTYIKIYQRIEFIKPSKSSASASILLDKKLDSSLSLCIDYQDLKNLTIKNWHPFLVIEETLNWLSWAKQFTQLDLTSTYHQMQIQKSNKWKTTFCTKYGHFKYQVIPFGFSNILTSFQSYINKILAEKLDIFVVLYFNNILIYLKHLGQPHVKAVQ